MITATSVYKNEKARIKTGLFRLIIAAACLAEALERVLVGVVNLKYGDQRGQLQ